MAKSKKATVVASAHAEIDRSIELLKECKGERAAVRADNVSLSERLETWKRLAMKSEAELADARKQLEGAEAERDAEKEFNRELKHLYAQPDISFWQMVKDWFATHYQNAQKRLDDWMDKHYGQ